MKKTGLLGVLLLLIVLLLAGCAEPAPEVEETATPEPTQAPTVAAPTVEPTVSPRPMQGVEWPEPGATLIAIDPSDKPTPEPIVFEPYREVSAENLGVKFEIPGYWSDLQSEGPSAQEYWTEEPANDIRSGVGIPASATVAISKMANQQDATDAENHLNDWITAFRAMYPTLEVSSTAKNKMLDQSGVYVTYWIYMDDPTGNPEPIRMRGRCLVVPSGNDLIMLRYLCPAALNSQYESVYTTLRDSMELL